MTLLMVVHFDLELFFNFHSDYTVLHWLLLPSYACHWHFWYYLKTPSFTWCTVYIFQVLLLQIVSGWFSLKCAILLLMEGPHCNCRRPCLSLTGVIWKFPLHIVESVSETENYQLLIHKSGKLMFYYKGMNVLSWKNSFAFTCLHSHVRFPYNKTKKFPCIIKK